MKIILCIFLLNITAVSVFGQSVPLDGTLGQSVKFPAAVKKGGSLIHSDVTIGDVTSGSFWTSRDVNYRDRVQWDSSTGLFSLSGLTKEDSGEYKVQNKDQNITTVFQLNVYIPVSKPHVSITHNEYPCTLLCAVERGTEATLSWYREGQKTPYSRSSVQSAPHLDLLQTVERSGTYTCEAKNSVSYETSDPLTVGAHCTDPVKWILIGVFLVLLLLAIVTYILWHRYNPFEGRRKGEKRLVLPPDDSRRLFQVKKLLNNVDLHPSGETSLELSPDGETSLELSPDGETRLELSPDAVRTLIHVKVLLNGLDLHAYGPVGKFIYHPEATEKMTSSHETEVL